MLEYSGEHTESKEPTLASGSRFWVLLFSDPVSGFVQQSRKVSVRAACLCQKHIIVLIVPARRLQIKLNSPGSEFAARPQQGWRSQRVT